MYLLSFVVVFHFSFTACFTNDSDADRIAFGCCLAARYAVAFATLYPSQLLLLESYVKTTRLPSSSTRSAFLLMSLTIGSTQLRVLCNSVSASLESVTISAR
jgi:hypothetical protein